MTAIADSKASELAVAEKIQKNKRALAVLEIEEKLHAKNSQNCEALIEKLKKDIKEKLELEKALAYLRSSSTSKRYARQPLAQTRQENHVNFIEDVKELQYDPSVALMYKLVNHGVDDNVENANEEDIPTVCHSKPDHLGPQDHGAPPHRQSFRQDHRSLGLG
jgi:hypothetical protein